jgi:pyridoxamine 5'-phosphate oxidase
MNDFFLQTDLPGIEAGVWALLERSTLSHKAGFHAGVLATIHNSLPELRTVILRKVDPVSKRLFFHTDIRSPKIKQLEQQPQMSWLFYAADQRIQLRLAARASIHKDDAVATEAWEQARLSSRLAYTSSSAAGTILPAPELIDLNQKEVAPELMAMAWENFCVIETVVSTMDWTFLHHTGNRRALFNYDTEQFQWIQV